MRRFTVTWTRRMTVSQTLPPCLRNRSRSPPAAEGRVRLDVLEAGKAAGQRHQAEMGDQAAAGERPEPGRAVGLGQLPPGDGAELNELVILCRGCLLVRGAARGPQLPGLPPVLCAGQRPDHGARMRPAAAGARRKWSGRCRGPRPGQRR